MKKIIAIPCQYMIFVSDGYIQCELKPCEKTFCLCAWFYDVCNPGFTIEISVDPSGKRNSVSTFDFPDSPEMKDIRERTVTEADVPKLCPKGFTFKQIDAKIQPLLKRAGKVKG
jgi:hypothetical protein